MLTAGKTIPAGELWAGRPAKKMRDLTAKELTFNQRSAHHYIEVARAHRLGEDGAPFDNMHYRPLPPLANKT
jgi:carbonic anhydrase/acetyltransferase-like protein (isoleucine patch superfamily)